MFGDLGLSRRAALGGAVGAMAMGAAPSVLAAGRDRLDLHDPAQRALARAKITGSAAKERVHVFYRLHVYAYLHEANILPLFTLNTLSITDWTPLANGTYDTRHWEAGVYCRFDTDEAIDEWVNPVTGEKRRVWQFRGGPHLGIVGPDGSSVVGADVKPSGLRMETVGDLVLVPSVSSMGFPNPIAPDKWPTQSSGPMRYWESHATYSAKIADVVNPRIVNAPATCIFQNMGTWHPWLGMGGRPGRSYGRAYGAKIAGLDALTPELRRAFETRTPEILEVDTWTRKYSDLHEYAAAHTPG